jgi:aldose sugar dehydrogenase
VTYGTDYDDTQMGVTQKEGMQQPVYYGDPSPAPSGMVFYDGDMFPDWQGQALIGALSGQSLIRLALEDERVTGEARHLQGIGRVRDVEIAEDGAVMLITDADNGQLIRITPEG